MVDQIDELMGRPTNEEYSEEMEEYDEDGDPAPEKEVVTEKTFPAGVDAKLVRSEVEEAAEMRDRGRMAVKEAGDSKKPDESKSKKNDHIKDSVTSSYRDMATGPEEVIFPEGIHGGEVGTILEGITNDAKARRSEKTEAKPGMEPCHLY